MSVSVLSSTSSLHEYKLSFLRKISLSFKCCLILFSICSFALRASDLPLREVSFGENDDHFKRNFDKNICDHPGVLVHSVMSAKLFPKQGILMQDTYISILRNISRRLFSFSILRFRRINHLSSLNN